MDDVVEKVDRYALVNAAWPEVLPAITREEARQAQKRLVRHFTSLKRRIRSRVGIRGDVRRCWVSTKPLRRWVERGWWRLVHDVSHRVFRVESPGTEGSHGRWHADLELEMVRYVVDHGWLDGRLKTVDPATSTVDERRVARLEHARKMLVAWEKKAKTAAHRIKKWRSRVKACERLLAKQSGGEEEA